MSTSPTWQPWGIDVIKDHVPIQRYATDVAPGPLKQVSETRMRGFCPVHNGDSATAFVVFLDSQRWWCHRCSVGGDLIDLCEMVERHADSWTAMLSLAQRYNVALPSKTDRWCAWQNEKGRVREAAKVQIARVYQRRLTRVYSPLVLLGGETPEEELKHLEELSQSLWPVALDWAQRRVNGGE